MIEIYFGIGFDSWFGPRVGFGLKMRKTPAAVIEKTPTAKAPAPSKHDENIQEAGPSIVCPLVVFRALFVVPSPHTHVSRNAYI